jgi:hypothetical protein
MTAWIQKTRVMLRLDIVIRLLPTGGTMKLITKFAPSTYRFGIKTT